MTRPDALRPTQAQRAAEDKVTCAKFLTITISSRQHISPAAGKHLKADFEVFSFFKRSSRIFNRLLSTRGRSVIISDAHVGVIPQLA